MIDEKEAVRLYVRKAIQLYKENKIQQEKLEEKKLRTLIRGLILKEVSEDQPKHSSTGINVLEDLLKKIIPVIQADFKILTTSQEQRQSFRSHVINAVQNTLSPEIAYALSDNKNKNIKEEIEVNLKNKDENVDKQKFIDIEDKQKEQEEELSPEEQFSRGLEDQNLDATGRNMSMETFKKIEKNISDAYSVLSDEKDKELFYDYLITNLKLYFDKFEEEMMPSAPPEPTTPEYEQEKERKQQEDSNMGA